MLKAKALEETAGRLETAKNYFDQFQEIRSKAAVLLDQAKLQKT